MKHSRHYTLDEANAALAWVAEPIAETAQRARGALRRGGARGARRGRRPRTAAATRAASCPRPSSQLRAALLELQEVEVVLRDLDRGLVDFPSIRDGREVYLCWVEGEDEIGYWHDLEAGFAGREPL